MNAATTGASAFFPRRDGQLHCEELPVADLAKEHGTPLFVYSAASIRDAYRRTTASLAFAPHTIAYAAKANDNLSILRLLKELGAGVDIVSRGELARALRAGFDPGDIVYSGVGKTTHELSDALQQGIRSIHLESAEELSAIIACCEETNTHASLAMRINPDVDPKTHPYIATGLTDTKFGLQVETARSLLSTLVDHPRLALKGIACHIGSQIQDATAMQEAVTLAGRFAAECRKAGAPIQYLDAGGGWPIDYQGNRKTPKAEAFGAAIKQGMDAAGVSDLSVTVELGRSLVGPAGALLAEVVFNKRQQEKRFVIVDAAMTDLLRPALYQAEHRMEPVRQRSEVGATSVSVDVVGPVCETGDFLARNVALPAMERGDLLAVFDTGAYGAVMSSRYNARPRAAEVLVDGNTATVIRRRERLEDLWSHEPLADG